MSTVRKHKCKRFYISSLRVNRFRIWQYQIIVMYTGVQVLPIIFNTQRFKAFKLSNKTYSIEYQLQVRFVPYVPNSIGYVVNFKRLLLYHNIIFVPIKTVDTNTYHTPIYVLVGTYTLNDLNGFITWVLLFRFNL